MLKKLGLIAKKYTLEPVAETENAVQHCIEMVHDGKADVLMRGSMQTADP